MARTTLDHSWRALRGRTDGSRQVGEALSHLQRGYPVNKLSKSVNFQSSPKCHGESKIEGIVLAHVCRKVCAGTGGLRLRVTSHTITAMISQTITTRITTGSSTQTLPNATVSPWIAAVGARLMGPPKTATSPPTCAPCSRRTVPQKTAMSPFTLPSTTTRPPNTAISPFACPLT